MAVSLKPSHSGSVVIWLRWFATLAAFALGAHAADWPKIDQAELAETKSLIDPAASAEILAREIVMDHFTFAQLDRDGGTITYGPSGAEDHVYVRVKIFSEKGVQRFSPLKLSCDPTAAIEGFAARTIQPDGTIAEVKSENVHDENSVTKSGRKVKLRSISFPALAPGAIVEYRYSTRTPKPAFIAILDFQSDLPTRLVRFKVGMIKHPDPVFARKRELNSVAYNCPLSNLVQKDGFVTFEKKDLPAFKAEKYQPPAFTTAMTLVMYIKLVDEQTPDTYWAKFSKTLQSKLDPWIKNDPAVIAALAGIVNESDSTDIKLAKLHNWCRTAIRNRERETTKLSKEETQKLSKNRKASDVLTQKIGSASEINFLFASLAHTAGFDVRLAACNDRTSVPFNKNITEPAFMLPDRTIAVKAGSAWRYFDPGASYLPAGALAAKNSDTIVLLSDPKGLEQPALATGEPAENNYLTRKASFTLATNGTLAGTVTETYSGLLEASLKDTFDALTTEKREALLTKLITRGLPDAAVTNIVVENADNPTGQLKVTYHIEIPNYADETGTRLTFHPAVFKKHTPATFTSSERKNSIVFPYRTTEKDELTFTLPEGYKLTGEANPQGLDATGLGQYNATVIANDVTHEIAYSREQILTDISFKNKAYPQLKTVFDHIYAQDQIELTLKRTDSRPEQDHTDAAASDVAKKRPVNEKTEPFDDGVPD